MSLKKLMLCLLYAHRNPSEFWCRTYCNAIYLLDNLTSVQTVKHTTCREVGLGLKTKMSFCYWSLIFCEHYYMYSVPLLHSNINTGLYHLRYLKIVELFIRLLYWKNCILVKQQIALVYMSLCMRSCFFETFTSILYSTLAALYHEVSFGINTVNVC